MRMKTIFLLSLFFLVACSSDDIVEKEKKELWNVFKNLKPKVLAEVISNTNNRELKKTRLWLSKFKQPIILISSLDKKNQATLVALGNNEEKLTWVSADGISVSYDQGVLIATRGYSQDLLSLQYKNPANVFSLSSSRYSKVHRYLNGDNEYFDIHFECSGKKYTSKTLQMLDYKITVDRFVEDCKSENYKYVNEYDLLAGTTIVVKSKQWISPTNESFLTYSFYAFQKF